jgi:predicted acylesterase/phospholipase RssA
MTPERVTVVLSGGGAKAAAHIGALKSLAAQGLRPTRIVATSMGAVFGATVAAGLTPEQALERALGVRAGDIGRPDPLALLRGVWAPAILKGDRLRHVLEQLVPARRFDQLWVPLTVTATDLESGALVPFGAGGQDAPLLDVLYGACALPVFFPPAIIAGRRYADGGLRAVLPLEMALTPTPDLVVAVDIGPGFDETGAPAKQPALVAAHDEATRILMAGNTALTVALWRATAGRPPLVYVRPHVERGATFRADLTRRYAEEGERAATEALAKWRERGAN